MRFIHIADLHLGLTLDPGKPWCKTWEADRLSHLQSIITLCNQKQIDLLLIAGDLFERKPELSQLKELNYVFSKLNQTYVVFIAGNHDHITEDSPYRDFEWNPRVIFLKKPTFTSAYFPNLDTEVCGFSYDRAQITEARYDEISPGSRGRWQILLAHGGDAEHVPMNYKKIASKGFDYIAMGHIHKPACWQDLNMAYSGSLMATDCNDTGKRGFIIGEITDAGTHFEFVPCAPHEYGTLRLQLNSEITQTAVEDQLKKILSENPGNVYHLIIEGRFDPTSPIDLERLKLCGNILDIADHSIPDFPLEELAKVHENDVVGMYLNSFDRENLSEVERKALYYGLDALLKGHRS